MWGLVLWCIFLLLFNFLCVWIYDSLVEYFLPVYSFFIVKSSFGGDWTNIFVLPYFHPYFPYFVGKKKIV